MEGYEQEEKRGKELNKDQKEALAKYPEVIGQIECVKELTEQLKKIQTDAQKHQKRLAKQTLEEKRLLIHQRVTEYAQLRYLFDHRPNSLKEDESTLLNQLSSLIVPIDNSSSTMTTSVDTVLSIYQGGSAVPKIKSLTGKNIQEIKEILEQLVKSSQQTTTTTTTSSSNDLQTNDEQVDQTQPAPAPPTTTIAIEEPETITTTTATTTMTTNNDQENIPNRTLNDYPLKFDTREQIIPLEQIIKDSPFLPSEPIQTQQILQDNHLQQQQQQQTNHSNQYNTMLTSTHPDQSSTLISNLEQNDVSPSGPSSLDQQQYEEQWQHTRTNNANQRNNQPYNQNNRYHYQNRPPHNYYSSGSNRGSRGGRYNNSYVPNQSGPGGQRPFHDNVNRGRGSANPNYRGNRGGNHRGGNHRGNGTYQGNGNNNYQKGQYHSNNEQQIRSAPPTNSSTTNHQ